MPAYLELIDEALGRMDAFFSSLEAHHPKPLLVRVRGSLAYRFRNQAPQTLVLQKLAHALSCLHGARILLAHGHVHEQGILHRVIDEANEDILVFSYAITNGQITEGRAPASPQSPSSAPTAFV